MTKIEALKQTLHNLENDIYEYRWSHSDTCNCGILARTILNGELPTKSGLCDYKDKNIPAISYAFGFSGVALETFNHCEVTGLPIPKVIKALLDCGFSFEELRTLEFYSTETRTDKEKLCNYFKRWIQRLESKKLELSETTVEELLKEKELVEL